MKAKLLAGVVYLTALGIIYFVATSSDILTPGPLNKRGFSTCLQGSVVPPGSIQSSDAVQVNHERTVRDIFQPIQFPKLDNSSADYWFSTFLFIMVPTRPTDTESRQLVRDTWFEGFQNNSDVTLRFAIGNSNLEPAKRLEYIKENETYRDIIFIDAPEGTDALTNKTLSLFIWTYRHVKYKYFMKCDDDTYVFIMALIDELKKRPTDTKFYYGRIASSNKPTRGKVKWADNDWDLAPYYIPFALGGGYILSYDLIALLSKQSPHLKWHINEDTAVGAWLSAFDMERRTDDRFCYWWKREFVLGCKCYKSHCSKWPVLVFMFHAHSFKDLKAHFTRFHKQVSSNTVITVPLTKEKFL